MTEKPLHSAFSRASASRDRWFSALLGLITIFGFALRVWQIGAKGLWLDEAFSVWMGWQPLPALVDWVVRIDQHPPLYYAVLHVWMKLAGDVQSAVRLPSAVFGAATIPVIGLLGRRLVSHPVGLIAALILALAPFHVRFAQEARMYTLLMFNASLTLLALAYIFTDPRRAALPSRRIFTDLAWLAYIVFCAATLWSHNTAIFFPLAVNVFALGMIWVGRRRLARGDDHPHTVRASLSRPVLGGQREGAPFPLKGDDRGEEMHAAMVGGLYPPSLVSWLFAQAGVVLLWLPWLVPFIAQATGIHREFWVPYPTWQSVTNTLKTFLSAMLPARDWLALGIWAAFGLLLTLGVWYLKSRPGVLALLLAVFFTPLVGEWVVSLWQPIYDDRTLIWMTVPLYLALSAGIVQLRHRVLALAALVGIVAVSFVSLRAYFSDFAKEGWDKAAAYVSERAEKEDMLLFNASWAQIPFDYYFRHYDRPVIEHGAPVDLFERGILEPKMAESDLPRLRELIANRRRVWLIYSHNWYTDPDGLIANALSEKLEQFDRQQFNGLEVRLFGAP